MGKYLLLVLAALLGWGGALLFHEPLQLPPPRDLEADARRHAAEARKTVEDVVRKIGSELAPDPKPTVIETRRVERDTVTLAIGDRFRFSDGAVLPHGAPGDWDVACLDIRHGAALRGRHGAAPAMLAPTLGGEAPDQTACWARLEDAPLHLPERDVWVRSQPAEGRLGIAFVIDAEGAAHKIMLDELSGDPDALKRLVRLRLATVPRKDGGGIVRIAGAPTIEDLPDPMRERIDRVRNQPPIPGDSFRRHLDGSWIMTESLSADTTIERPTWLAVSAALSSTVRLETSSAIYAARGISDGGKVEVDAYAGLIVEGNLDGTVHVGSYAYVHITGNLRGRLVCDSYCTVVVEGNISGRIEIKSYVTLHLNGRFIDPERSFQAAGSCWSTFYFQRHHTAADLESFRGARQITLHVRSSDLPSGSHEGIGSWRKVIVGDPIWGKTAR